MKRYNFSKILAPLGRTFMALTIMAGMSACDNVIYDYGDDCDPDPENPAPKPEPDLIRIYVRSNPGGGGTSQVHEVADETNSASTTEGIYVSINVEENGTYTLTAVESNPGYVFVRWHDDTNDGDLSEGVKVIANIKAETSTKYTAIFRKVEEPDEPEPEPGHVRISVRSSPGGGGTSKVHEVADASNSATTTEGIYVSIEVEENGTYTLTATESNPEYVFVRWHDDTNDSDLSEGVKVISNIKAEESAKYTAIFRKVNEPEDPSTPEPGHVRISVRSNPGGGGTSKVHEVAKTSNKAETTEGLYVSIEVEENGTYTLTATESNPEYVFVRWHDDTNDSDLSEGVKVISNIKAEESAKYTAIFRKINEPEQPGQPDNPKPDNPKPDDPTPDEAPEGYYVKFVFDRNMQFTDGFSQRVSSVDLYVFNQSGTLITKYHEHGTALKQDGYLMELTDLPAGTYELIAWCGLTDERGTAYGHFTVERSITQNFHTVCTMPTKSDAVHKAYQNENLAALFHGRETKATYVEKTAQKQIHTVYLTKNTNNVNITLQHRQGLPFEKDRFVVKMHDMNDVMKHDNEMFEGVVQEVQYRPYRTVYGYTANAGNENTGNYLQVELSTARLMTTNNPIIEVVDTENDKVIFSIPLVKWALQLRSAQYKGMDPQEYLDREDNYNLMLWMDSNRNDGWFGAEININDWHVVDDTWSY